MQRMMKGLTTGFAIFLIAVMIYVSSYLYFRQSKAAVKTGVGYIRMPFYAAIENKWLNTIYAPVRRLDPKLSGTAVYFVNP